MQSERERAGAAAKEMFVRSREAVVAMSIEREAAAVLAQRKADTLEARRKARIKAAVDYEYEALQTEFGALSATGDRDAESSDLPSLIGERFGERDDCSARAQFPGGTGDDSPPSPVCHRG